MSKPNFKKVPSKKTQERIEYLKRRKSFEDIFLEELKNIHPKAFEAVCPTNYKHVFLKRLDDKFTFCAQISNKKFKWWDSFADVISAAKAADKKLLEYNLPPVNFNFQKFKEVA